MDPIAQHMPQVYDSSKRSIVAKIPSQPSALAVCQPEEAMFQASLLLGCYRKADCEDPEVFIASVSAVLSRYSAEVVALVTSPVSGVPAKSKFLPTIAEIREACEREQQKRDRWREQQERIENQLSERDRIAALRDGQGSAERRKAFIAREMASLERDLRRDDSRTDVAALDVRGMPEGRARRAIEAKIRDRLEWLRVREPLRLSGAALRTLGIDPAPTMDAGDAA